jgi:hypothetical protein
MENADNQQHNRGFPDSRLLFHNSKSFRFRAMKKPAYQRAIFSWRYSRKKHQ